MAFSPTSEISFAIKVSLCTKKLSRYSLLSLKQGYKDSNLEMTESESVALPFGDSPLCDYFMHYT